MSTLPNACLSSTTFDVEEVKIRRPRRAQGHSASAASTASASGARLLRAWRFANRLDWRKPVTVQMRYLGGNDPHIEVRARGHVDKFPWDVALLDVLAAVTSRLENRC